MRPPSEYGLWFLGVPGSYVVGSYIATRLLVPLGLDRSIVLGSVAGALVLPAAAALYNFADLTPLLLFGPAYAIAFFQGLVISNGMAGAINTVPGAAGAASGLVGFLQMTISATAAQLSGAFVRDSVWPLMIIMSVSMGVSLLLLPMIRNHGAAVEPAAASPTDRP